MVKRALTLGGVTGAAPVGLFLLDRPRSVAQRDVNETH